MRANIFRNICDKKSLTRDQHRLKLKRKFLTANKAYKKGDGGQQGSE